MSIEVVRGTNQKPVSSTALINLLEKLTVLSGQLFVGYPIIGTAEGPYVIDALLIARETGIVIINLIEGLDFSGYENTQDDSVNKLESKLKLHRELMDRRQLLIPVHVVSFAPALHAPIKHESEYYPIANSNTLLDELTKIERLPSGHDIYEKTLSVIENISAIRRTRSRRSVKLKDSRGAKLKRLEESIATLDNMQSKAVIETVEGVQRIRGLAGSGKTIVLALKAAYFHAQHPEWRIAVTFNTRSLKGQFRHLINTFSLEQTSQEPDWEYLHIVNAWGAPGDPERDGVYYEFCRVHDIPYFDLKSARGLPGHGGAFTRACQLAIHQVPQAKPMYDAILVDEAQDFSPAFLRLCHMFLKDPKRLVYAYDELQNLTEESLPSPEDIFGGVHENASVGSVPQATNGGPRNDIILQKCYRNSRPVLVTAHALGFGIYREATPNSRTGLIQMFDNAQLWREVGYRVGEGNLGDGERVVLQRTESTSPMFLENHSPIEDLIQFIHFESQEEQALWLANAIKINLTEDELRHDDIVVINPDPRTTRANIGRTRRLLWEMGINSHLAGVDTDPDVFFRPDNASMTFTGVFRAKGNEAGMVYVINAQDCHSSALNLARIRNQLFTAITRSKAWIRVLGVGDGMTELIDEYEELKNHNFELDFIYPDAEQRQQLRIVHRDTTKEEHRKLRGLEQELTQLVEQLQSGQIRAEDLDESVVSKLKELLS